MQKVKHIRPETDTTGQYMAKVWQYRSLAVTFARRELKIKYAGTYLGFGWLIVYPLAMLTVYFVFFNFIYKINTPGTPYLLFAFSGIIPWLFFSSVFNAGSTMLATHRDLISKVYFPRFVLIAAKAMVSSLELIITLGMYMALALFYHRLPTLAVVLLPVFWVAGVVVAVAFSLWASFLSFSFKDTNQFLPVIVNLFMWLTPVFYPVSAFPERFKFLAYLNPMTFVLDGYRLALLGASVNTPYWILSAAVTLILLVSGMYFFIQKEDSLAENL